MRLSDLSRLDGLATNAYEAAFRSGVIDAANGYAYFGVNYISHIVKVDLGVIDHPNATPTAQATPSPTATSPVAEGTPLFLPVVQR